MSSDTTSLGRLRPALPTASSVTTRKWYVAPRDAVFQTNDVEPTMCPDSGTHCATVEYSTIYRRQLPVVGDDRRGGGDGDEGYGGNAGGKDGEGDEEEDDDDAGRSGRREEASSTVEDDGGEAQDMLIAPPSSRSHLAVTLTAGGHCCVTAADRDDDSDFTARTVDHIASNCAGLLVTYAFQCSRSMVGRPIIIRS